MIDENLLPLSPPRNFTQGHCDLEQDEPETGMAAGTAKRPVARKRNRKRKRRDVSSSSSSSSEVSSDSENEREREPTTVKIPQKRPSAAVPASATLGVGDDESSSEGVEEADSVDSSSESDSESELEASIRNTGPAATNLPKPTSAVGDHDDATAAPQPTRKARAPSPPPVRNVPVPNILNEGKEKEEALRARFRQFWLGCVADAFADDLNEIRKEPNLTPARLSLLIDSLAAGADLYSSSSSSSSSGPGSDGKRINEMEIVLGE